MKVRGVLVTLLLVWLAGCSAPPKVAQIEEAVRPIPLEQHPLAVYGSRDLAQALLRHYQTGPVYVLRNPQMLATYTPAQTLISPNNRHLIQMYQKAGAWGFVSLATTQRPVMNAFELTDAQGRQTYALVLRGVKVCLVTGAARPPFWGGSQWVHSTVNPGKFECSGQTNGSFYAPGSGMPGKLGIYYADGDTVLYGDSRAALNAIADRLSHQFVHLQVPAIHSSEVLR